MSTTKVVTSKKNLVRFSYAHVFEAQSIDGSDPKYSVNIIISKDDKENLQAIKDAIAAAKDEGKTKKWDGKIPGRLKLPLRDGDEERPDDEVYENSMFINCSSKSRPSVVDEDLNPIMDKDEFYSGCYGRVSVNFYPFNTKGNKGIAAGLNNVQKLEDGEKLSGGSTATEDFGDDDSLM